MSKLNFSTSSNKAKPKTQEGGTGKRISAYQELRRTVCACLLWEDSFYENGQDVYKRIKDLSNQVTVEQLHDLAIEVRNKMNLRHVGLVLLSSLCVRGSGMRNSIVKDAFYKVINRADELTEFICVFAKFVGTTPDRIKKVLPAQAKKGLAKAFVKFDEYQLAKYNRDGIVKLRDVLFLCHPKPLTSAQQDLWNRLVKDELRTPDTWEVELSSGADKAATFTRLLKEKKLGHLAVLRNLRNMVDSGVDNTLIKNGISTAGGKDKTLPFRYVAAARACPSMSASLSGELAKSMDSMSK